MLLRNTRLCVLDNVQEAMTEWESLSTAWLTMDTAAGAAKTVQLNPSGMAEENNT